VQHEMFGRAALYVTPFVSPTGTFSFLAQGLPLDEAVARAKEYINAAIIAGAAYEIGHGHGPVHHFFNFWE